MLPIEPFLSRFRLLLKTNRHVQTEWMCIISTSWESMQYLDSATTTSEFMGLYPFHDTLNAVHAYIATRESRKTELRAFHLEVLWELAHLHPDTAGAGSPSPYLAPPLPDPPDGTWYSNKHKLTDTTSMLSQCLHLLT